ncbi:TPM domain-containing protein [Candidatus Falkowbacteria bacterium]|uniref:Methanol dehydrogenase n=1 Tax=Candidatus Falkowbacteria bacterium CG10_big_fil_rev_8_21_14_0_10_37_18 TaxID=1974562 RepID=A0A2H0V983_9BACT|nr:TPM domain-containing protein [Candidatus Falkowbacteria bacterium]PIR95656.1 MAG: methanol dehydrogenase [Candidatus Falkowbacteria bacterium CG10_big_fil_rev_8_21_14_0_10_37_18]
MLGRIVLIVFLALFTAGLPARAYNNPGQPVAFVNDYAGVLSSEQKSSLENKLTQFTASSTNEVAVVIISSLEGDSIENYANKLFADWKIGTEKQNNGVLLLIAINDKKMRIETGYGLEGALPDATANQIITKTLRPAFQANDYYSGIDAATNQIILATQGEYSADASAGGGLGNWSFDSIVWIMIMSLYLLSALYRYLARSKSWWEGGVLGAVIGLIVSLIFFSSLVSILTPVLAVCGFIFDYLVSRVFPAPKPLKKGGGIWFLGGPGGFGGRGGSGGGFGGFGGGSSGGGGASGGW